MQERVTFGNRKYSPHALTHTHTLEVNRISLLKATTLLKDGKNVFHGLVLEINGMSLDNP
jgi:hypothetical protein